jgi:uncharacterized cupin superfamily protein
MTAVARAQRADVSWSFIDLKSWALRAVADPIAGDPFIAGRRPLYLGDGPVTAGALQLRAGEGQVAGQPVDEFLHVVAGGLALEVGELRFELDAGQSIAIPPGTPFGWRCGQPTVLIYMRHAASEGPAPGPRLMDPTTDRQPSNPPLADLLTTPTPQCRNHTQYASADGAFVCGVWDSTPYARNAMTYGHHELMHLLEGAVTFVDDTGEIATFTEGDVLLVRRGARCSWLSDCHVTKVFAIYRPG